MDHLVLASNATHEIVGVAADKTKVAVAGQNTIRRGLVKANRFGSFVIGNESSLIFSKWCWSFDHIFEVTYYTAIVGLQILDFVVHVVHLNMLGCWLLSLW